MTTGHAGSWKHLGVSRADLMPGNRVMVALTAGAAVGEGPAVICLAEVLKPVKGREGLWWLRVYMGGPEPMPQMFRAEEILGVPALGLRTASEVS